MDTLQNAVVIPTAALQMSNDGHFVWVVNSDNKVSKKRVTAGLQDSQKVVIDAGLQAGQRVVTDGLDRLTEGATVEIVAAQSTAAQHARGATGSRRTSIMQVMPPDASGGPSRQFILRPVATTLLMIAILLAGVLGYRFLPVSALPEVDYPTIQVVTLYPGASPDVVTSSITAPLERQFGQMSGLKQMASQTLQFQLTLALDVAEQEVQAAINSATNLLPNDLPNPPVYSKVNPADPPIMTLAVTTTSMPLTQVQDMVETRWRRRFPGLRRRSGHALRRPASGSAGEDERSGAGGPRPHQRDGAHRHQQRQRQFGERQS